MDQKFIFGGTIGYVGLYLEFLFRHFKVFRLHATLDDAAEAVRAHSGKGHGHKWTRTNFMSAWSSDWTTLSPLRKTLSTLHFQLC